MDYVVFSSVQMEAAHLEEVQGEILGSIMPSLEHTQIESMVRRPHFVTENYLCANMWKSC